jgi:ADP-heptose:LPS heptosyltransferase
MGDVVMDAPAVQALKQKFPNAKLSVLVHYNLGGDEVCRLMKSVDETIDIELEGYRWRQVIVFMLSRFWKLLFKLRRRRFDLVVVSWPNPIRRLLLAGMGSKYWIYGNLVDEYPGLQDAKILKQIGIGKIDAADISPVFQVPEPANPEQILPSNLPKPLIGVHPFCGMEWREWKKFDQLQVELAKLGSVIVVGKRAGHKTSKDVHNLVNKLSITELFWVIKNCDVFVAADSGPMHISFVLGRPTVALFGPVAPALRVPPEHKGKIKVIYKESANSARVRHATDRKKLDNTAMQQITVEEVLETVRELLASK